MSGLYFCVVGMFTGLWLFDFERDSNKMRLTLPPFKVNTEANVVALLINLKQL